MSLRIGRYETLHTIASGGMGTVYLGRALGVGGFQRLVAIKVMHKHLVTEPSFVSMFLDEARLAAQIRHPNVVATLDVQQERGLLFIVMDYIEGASLLQLNKRAGEQGQVLPVGVALRIFCDVLAGLHAAHELKDASGEPYNLVHRDVSPDNMLIGVDGVCRLTDFGVARARARITKTQEGQVKGKLAYMPPEQLAGKPAHRTADIYSAAVVLWETLVGRRCHMADTEAALLFQVVNGVEQSPRAVRPEVPEAVDAVCMRALSMDPAERYPTAADFAAALDDAGAAAGVRLASAQQVAAAVRPCVVPIHKSFPPPAVPAIDDLQAPTSAAPPPTEARITTVAHGSTEQLTAASADAHRSAGAPLPNTALLPDTGLPETARLPDTGVPDTALLPVTPAAAQSAPPPRPIVGVSLTRTERRPSTAPAAEPSTMASAVATDATMSTPHNLFPKAQQGTAKSKTTLLLAAAIALIAGAGALFVMSGSGSTGSASTTDSGRATAAGSEPAGTDGSGALATDDPEPSATQAGKSSLAGIAGTVDGAAAASGSPVEPAPEATDRAHAGGSAERVEGSGGADSRRPQPHPRRPRPAAAPHPGYRPTEL